LAVKRFARHPRAAVFSCSTRRLRRQTRVIAAELVRLRVEGCEHVVSIRFGRLYFSVGPDVSILIERRLRLYQYGTQSSLLLP
jgi:hypothetical protein